jgi:hypothetical protein
MLNLKRDNTAEAVGVWNFTSTPTLNGLELSTAVTTDNSKVLKTGDTMTGALTLAASSFSVVNSSVIINTGNLKVRNRNAVQAHFYGYEPVISGAGENEGSIIIGGGGGTAGTGLRISQYSGGTGYVYFDNLQAGTSPGDFVFRTNAAANTVFNISNAGVVSAPGRMTIGGSTGLDKLSVAGNIGLSGVIYSSGTTPNYFTAQLRAPAIVLGRDGNDSIDQTLYLNNVAATRAWNIQRGLDERLAIWSYNGSAWTEKFSINQNGNVGVGTTAPASKLHAIGEIRASSATTAGASICLAGAFDTLPTTGYARGCLAYLTSAPTKIYLSTETVVGTYSWLEK